jgi:two-component system sensor histidine kinase VicK
LNTATAGHRMKIDIPRNLPPVEIDEVRIGEVITNLVTNAAAYSEEGTEIVLEARKWGDEIVVSVADDGIGIPPSELERVFDRFHRLEAGTARRRGGIGLGLAIAREIVSQHGGRIWAESRAKGGSKFSFTLPVMEVTDEEDDDVESKRDMSLGGIN